MRKQIKPDMAELIIQMQQQLISLEKKIDALTGRLSSRPFEGGQQRSVARQDRDRSQRALYKAVCADCNKECEVPFRPSGDRPVYCKECFSSRKGGGSFHSERDNRPEKKDFTPPLPFERYRKKPGFKRAKNKKRPKR